MPATLRQADRTTSHLTKPANNAGKVIGYQGERDILVAGLHLQGVRRGCMGLRPRHHTQGPLPQKRRTRSQFK